MIKAEKLSFGFSSTPLFQDISFNLEEQEFRDPSEWADGLQVLSQHNVPVSDAAAGTLSAGE